MGRRGLEARGMSTVWRQSCFLATLCAASYREADGNWPSQSGRINFEGLKAMSSPDVVKAEDEYDKGFDFAFQHAKMTTGQACCSM